MKDRERIGNLEELMAENLMRLDRLEHGQVELKVGQLRLEGSQEQLQENQILLQHGQNVLQECMLDLTKVVRKNSTDIEVLKTDVAYLKENMSTKQGLNNLFEAMMNRFDRSDKEMALMRQDIDILKAR